MAFLVRTAMNLAIASTAAVYLRRRTGINLLDTAHVRSKTLRSVAYGMSAAGEQAIEAFGALKSDFRARVKRLEAEREGKLDAEFGSAFQAQTLPELQRTLHESQRRIAELQKTLERMAEREREREQPKKMGGAHN